MASPLGELDLNEYDIGGFEPRDTIPEDTVEDMPHATQMEEELGVQDLGVDDVVNQTKVRVVRPKLDADKLLHPRRGYPALLKNLRQVKYRGPGHERKYLQKYVMTYQIWANRLWPKANFHDFVVLARRAGRDPRIRQYCRDLIDAEKYSEPTKQPGPQTDEAQQTALPADSVQYIETPPEEDHPSNDVGNDVGNDEEWEAAMELYGGMDL